MSVAYHKDAKIDFASSSSKPVKKVSEKIRFVPK